MPKNYYSHDITAHSAVKTTWFIIFLVNYYKESIKITWYYFSHNKQNLSTLISTLHELTINHKTNFFLEIKLTPFLKVDPTTIKTKLQSSAPFSISPSLKSDTLATGKKAKEEKKKGDRRLPLYTHVQGWKKMTNKKLQGGIGWPCGNIQRYKRVFVK